MLGDEIWYLEPAPLPEAAPEALSRSVEVLPEPIAPSLTSVVRMRCPLGHEWTSNIDRTLSASGELSHPYCPDCGRDHTSYSDLRHG